MKHQQHQMKERPRTPRRSRRPAVFLRSVLIKEAGDFQGLGRQQRDDHAIQLRYGRLLPPSEKADKFRNALLRLLERRFSCGPVRVLRVFRAV